MKNKAQIIETFSQLIKDPYCTFKIKKKDVLMEFLIVLEIDMIRLSLILKMPDQDYLKFLIKKNF